MEKEDLSILVVDDDSAVRQALQLRLSAAGYRVDTVSSGEEAVRACAETPPDVITLDVSLPGMDGYQVCERIREQVSKPVTVIFLTGATHAGTGSHLEQLVNQSGGDYFVAKPYDPEFLVELIARISNDVLVPHSA